MRRKLLFLAYLILSNYLLIAQSNVPTTATGPSSATPKLLPLYYPDPSRDYLRALTPIMPTTDTSRITISASADSVNITTQYFDELGRPFQTIIKQASPNKNDFVLPYYYDEFSRESLNYLPYVQLSGNTNDGKVKANPLYYDSSFYKSTFSNEQINYSQKIFDYSPLQKVTKETAPGNSWTGSGIGISYSWRANTTSDSVRVWTIATSSEDDLPSTSAIYQAGSLSVEESTDEGGIKTVTYKDELDRLILSKKQFASSPTTGHNGWLCTYYVYDEMNHLRIVISPKAVETVNNSTSNWTITSNINGSLCFSYYYDFMGRPVMKGIPGKGKVYFAYDELDRIVMSQDPNLRSTNQWSYILYDGLSRPIKNGIITTSSSKDSILAQASRSTNYPTLSGTYIVTTETYYDDYNWISSTGAPISSSLVTTNINSTNFNTSYNSFPDYPQSLTNSSRIRGAVTGIKKLVLNSSNYLYFVNIYDDHGRLIQAKQTNYTGGTDVITKQYSFAGAILRTHLAQEKSGSNSQNHTILSKYSYDHFGRIKSITKNLDGLGDKSVNQSAYNELGQLQAKTLGSNIEAQNYTYNIRGWLLGINKGFIDSAGSTSHYFGEGLSYDYGFTNTKVNGAIAGEKWKAAGDGIARAYGFTYDNANRLTIADFSQQNQGSTTWTNSTVNFSVTGLSYDAGGNILTMNQKGLVVGTSTTIDSLTYQYNSNSNQLQKVNDGISLSNPLGDFKDTTLTSDDYTFDANGNIIKDYNKHMHTTSNGNGVVYNFLDKPDSIVISNKETVNYYYDASGNTLRKKINDYSSGALVVKDYTYFNGFVYLNDTLQFVLHEEGRIRYAKKVYNGSIYYSYEYDYFLKDHLGNVRTVLTEGRDTSSYKATMETADSATVDALFSNVYSPVNTVYPKPSGFDSDAGNHYVSRLNATSGIDLKVGPSKVLKVMAGDQVQVATYAFYNTTVQPPVSGINLVSDILNVLSPGIIGTSSGKIGSSDQTTLSTAISPNVTHFLDSSRSYDNTQPKAYLNWILFDDQFNYVASNSGVQQVQSGSSKQALVSSLQTISKNGYLYVYVSNESPQDVYFDDLTITHYTGPLLQEQSYYPFGLQMAGISDKALNKQSSQYKFNGGVELEEDGVNLYSTYYRQYDPQLGRFTGVDDKAEYSNGTNPYQFASNNPINFNDPFGDLSSKDFLGIVSALFASENGGQWSKDDPSHVYFYGDAETADIFGGLSALGVMFNFGGGGGDGGGAWNITNKWDADYIQKYRDWARVAYNSHYKEANQNFTCEDFALNLLLVFSAANGLPLNIKNGSNPQYGYRPEVYASFDDYYSSVASTTAAGDLANWGNTISTSNPMIGDLILLHHDNGSIYHTQVITNITDQCYYITQGNFVRGLERVGRELSPGDRDDPYSWGYLGTTLQLGYYSRANGVFHNTTLNERITNLKGNYYSWNFYGFNH